MKLIKLGISSRQSPSNNSLKEFLINPFVRWLNKLKLTKFSTNQGVRSSNLFGRTI
jgi:hypothetical protein